MGIFMLFIQDELATVGGLLYGSVTSDLCASVDFDIFFPVRAALYNKVDLIRLLMCHGGDINAKDKKNMAPIHHACWKGQKEAVEYLLEHGAQLAEVDSSLKTPLHWTVQFGHYETLLVLLKVITLCFINEGVIFILFSLYNKLSSII